jgi:hypothetical protein
MKYHKIDPVSKVYIETVELEQQPENSVPGELPEITDLYTVAFIDEVWVSVLKEQPKE